MKINKTLSTLAILLLFYISGCSNKIIDCGISDSLVRGHFSSSFDWESDNTFICIWDNLLDGCIPSQSIIKEVDINDTVSYFFDIRGIENNKCVLRKQHSFSNDVPLMRDSKKYLDCEIPINSLSKLKPNVNIEIGSGRLGRELFLGFNFLKLESYITCTGPLLNEGYDYTKK